MTSRSTSRDTDYSFLQSPWFLLALVLGAIILAAAERRLSPQKLDHGAPLYALSAVSLALGALFFAGALADGNYTAWPGLIGGVLCALVGIAATRPLLVRVRARLDAASASARPALRRGRRTAGCGSLGARAPGRTDRAGRAVVVPACRPPTRRAEVRGPADSSVSARAKRKKLVLVVIDALKPAMLERAIATGRAPALARIREEGVYVDDCVAAFPSVTPVCAATITTGVGPDRHLIPSMNWYHREEARYVEYGSSFSASRQFGVLRSLTDTVYRMNAEHLSHDVETVFESLDDADIRTAGTTYLIYRGRHQHEVSNETALARIVTSTLFRRTIDGPLELFYADLYASRKTGCRGQLGMPGIRDQHTGCVGAYLVEHDLFDFLLFSLPDNDAWSHKNGPHAQVTSIAAADRQLERLMHAAGGPDAFLEDHAVIVTSDHSQAAVEERIRLDEAFADFKVATNSPSRSVGAEVALSPAQRSAMIYALDDDRRDELVQRSLDAAGDLDGVDLLIWKPSDDRGRGAQRARRAAVLAGRRSPRWTRRSLERRRRAGHDPSRDPGRPLPVHRVPGRARADVVRGQLLDRGRRAPFGCAGLRVRRLGWRRPRRRWLARFASPLRLARGAAVVRHRPAVAHGA